MKKLAVVLGFLVSGSAFAHNWFPEGQRITTYTSGGPAYVTPLTSNRSFDTKEKCDAFLADQRALNSFNDANGKAMRSVVVAGCSNAPVRMLPF